MPSWARVAVVVAAAAIGVYVIFVWVILEPR
jgi:hypothetical protein